MNGEAEVAEIYAGIATPGDLVSCHALCDRMIEANEDDIWGLPTFRKFLYGWCGLIDKVAWCPNDWIKANSLWQIFPDRKETVAIRTLSTQAWVTFNKADMPLLIRALAKRIAGVCLPNINKFNHSWKRLSEACLATPFIRQRPELWELDRCHGDLDANLTVMKTMKSVPITRNLTIFPPFMSSMDSYNSSLWRLGRIIRINSVVGSPFLINGVCIEQDVGGVMGLTAMTTILQRAINQYSRNKKNTGRG